MSFPEGPNAPGDPSNPYQAPVAELAQPPELIAVSPKVIGILSIVFASIVMVAGLIGLLVFEAASRRYLSPVTAAEEYSPWSMDMLRVVLAPMRDVHRGFMYQCAILTVMSIALLVIGIGQVRYRKWACNASLSWGGTALVCVGAMIAIVMLIITPAYSAIFDLAARLPSRVIAARVATWNGLIGTARDWLMAITVVLYTPYPVVLLYFFSRGNVRAAMTR